MPSKPIQQTVFLILSLLIAPLAGAHTGMNHGLAGLADGFMHPVTGVDHFLVAIGAGFWMAGSGRHCILCTMLFLGMFLAGILLGVAALAFPAMAIHTILVFLLTWLVVAVAIARQDLFGYTLFGSLALYQGLVHIMEMSRPATLGGYAAGLLLATGLLLALGIILRQVMLARKYHN
jgi:urease accessory protein